MPENLAVTEFAIKVIGAIGVIFALLMTWRTHAERATFEMIDRLYTLCHTLESHLLKDWRLAHLFCIGDEDYHRTKQRVAEGLSPDALHEYQVKEKIFIVHICIIYEQVYYQWDHSSFWLHWRRRAFLAEMLSYFTDRLMMNPRLLAFLELDPDGTGLHLEKRSRHFLESKRSKLKKSPFIDRTGPFLGAENPYDSQIPPMLGIDENPVLIKTTDHVT